MTAKGVDAGEKGPYKVVEDQESWGFIVTGPIGYRYFECLCSAQTAARDFNFAHAAGAEKARKDALEAAAKIIENEEK